LPNRIIDVGTAADPTRLRLHKGGFNCGISNYAALSHRWNAGSKVCETTIANYPARLQYIGFDSLTKTFQDAIIVARQLGIQYLWIDSLCIIQDDAEDWMEEALNMQFIYSMAFCTFAVTPSEYSDGFLRRSPTHFVKLGDKTPYAFISKTSASFERDVEEGQLSTRGWILQERALSRRTIHFTETQTYFECGIGIFCETDEQIRYVSYEPALYTASMLTS